MVGGQVELGRERCVSGTESEALGAGLVIDRRISLRYRLAPRDEGERGQDDRDDQAAGQHASLQPGDTVRRPPGRRDERPLATGRRGLRMSVPFGHPRLRLPQIPAAQQATAVSAVRPLPRPDQQPGVDLDPVQVGVQRLDQFLEAGLEPGVVVKEDPIPLGDSLSDRLAVAGLTPQQRDDVLVRLDCVREFRRTRTGVQRIGGDHENEFFTSSDRGVDL